MKRDLKENAMNDGDGSISGEEKDSETPSASEDDERNLEDGRVDDEEQSGSENDEQGMEGSDMDEDGQDEEDDEEAVEVPSSNEISEKLVLPEGVEKCSLDLKNLTASNSYPLNPDVLYQKASVLNPGAQVANEEYLLTKSSEACQQLIAAIWSLPREASQNAGPLALLPAIAEIKTPRALPPPVPKGESRWDKFAKERGMAPNRKRERKVFDEATGEWMYRHGYQRANKGPQEWPIMEVKRGADPFEDPWQAARDAKKARLDKNLKSRLRNEEDRGAVPRGTTRAAFKQKARSREEGRSENIPAGLPVDLTTGKFTGEIRNSVRRGKELTQGALLATQRSTASLGKFDKMREGEPERKAAMRRRQFEASTPARNTEKDRNMNILNRVINGGAKLDKMKRDGSLAKGETAYDYDYNDSLGPSTFKKKRGRAGAGKIKKVTKKRIK